MTSDKAKKEFKEYFIKMILPNLKKIVLVKEPTTGVFRIVYKNNIIEYYPSSGKYFNITKQIRGQLDNGMLEEILELFD